MNVLALDTASPRPAVALSSAGRLFEEPLPAERRASEELLPALRRVLAAAGVSLEACDRVGVCAGPGSFTGLRVGLATGWGFGRARGIAVEAVSTLEAMAEAARGQGSNTVVAVLDAGRGDVVAQRFDLAPPRARALGPAVLRTPANLGDFAGEDRVVSLPEDLIQPRSALLASSVAAALATAMARAPRQGEGDSRMPLGAIYARPSAAEEKHGAA